MKIGAIILAAIITTPAFAQDQRAVLDPTLSYRMSADGWLWRWGDGHRYNGEIDEARRIWRTTFGYAVLAMAGAIGGSIAITKEEHSAAVFCGLSSVVGGISFLVQRNQDISTAPLHAIAINLKFGGTMHELPPPEPLPSVRPEKHFPPYNYRRRTPRTEDSNDPNGLWKN